MEQKERMDQGLIYDPADNRISTEQTSCLDAQYEFNATRPSEMKKRAALLKQMLGAIGENCYIEPPFRANWGGKHVYMGNNIKAFTKELSAIGRNINQIAKRINAGGPAYQADMDEIRERLDEIWQLQRHILSSQR